MDDHTKATSYLKSDELSYGLITKAVDESVTGIIITDNMQPDNPIIYCNKAFEVLTGYNRADIIGHNCRFLQREDRGQSAREEMRNAIKSGSSINVEVRNYKKDGTLFWNELYVSPVRNENGQVTNFIGIQNDITEKKDIQEELKLLREGLEKSVAERTANLKMEKEFSSSILETIRESLIVLDADLNVLSVNKHFLRTFKVSRVDTEKKKLYDLGNGQWNIPELKVMLEKVLPTNNPVLDFEVRHNFPHIGEKFMLLNAFRIELEGQYRDRVLLAIEDVTDRRLVEIRKDDFLSIASHELKTPLTTVKGYGQLLKKMMPDDASEQYKLCLEKSNHNLERLDALITELLDVSKIQTGHLKIHRSEVNFDNLVAESVEMINGSGAVKKITISGATSQMVSVDEIHLVQVINNLISNATKYSPGRDEIVVHLSKVSNYVKFAVTDYGLGISAADQRRIFERFYRVGEVQKRFPGMGIGLYVCDQIIRAHEGTLWVESELGQGSTFSFTIPINNSNPEA